MLLNLLLQSDAKYHCYEQTKIQEDDGIKPHHILCNKIQYCTDHIQVHVTKCHVAQRKQLQYRHFNSLLEVACGLLIHS